MDDARMIAAAKRKARRMARKNPKLTHHQALDAIARDLGRRHWSDFLERPVAVPRDERPKDDARGSIRFDVPIRDEAFLREQRVALFGLSATTLYAATEGDPDLVVRRLGEMHPGIVVDLLEAGPGIIDSYLGSIMDGAAGRYAPE
jgi:hypothetical protein